jgi:hypothetical protein
MSNQVKALLRDYRAAESLGAQPHTMRPSHSMTSVLHGHVHWNFVAR